MEFSNNLIGVEKMKSKANFFAFNPLRIFRMMKMSISQYAHQKNERYSLQLLYSKIDFCSCVVPNEFPLIKMISGFRAGYLQYIIGFKENPFIKNDNIDSLGDAIWIGNSYTLSNNHLEVFFQLKELDVRNEIIVPLSYGLNPIDYPQLIEIGEEFFENRFYPITEFMPFNDYNTLLKKSKVAIFNHIRQQAVFNVIMMLWQGAKVFLSDKSPVYSFFKSKGAIVFSIENELTIENINNKLTVEQIMKNRNIVYQRYSTEAIERTNMETIQFLIQKVQNNKNIKND